MVIIEHNESKANPLTSIINPIADKEDLEEEESDQNKLIIERDNNLTPGERLLIIDQHRGMTLELQSHKETMDNLILKAKWIKDNLFFENGNNKRSYTG